MSLRSTGFVPVLAAAATLALEAPAHAASESVELFLPLGFFVLVGVVAALIARAHQRHTAEQHQTLRAMVDKGLEIPPHLLGTPPAMGRRRDVRRGVFLILAGVGLAIFLWIEEGLDGAALGLLPAYVGAAYFIVAWLDRPRAAGQPSLT